MSEISDASKKIVATAVAGAIGVTGGVAVTHKLRNEVGEQPTSQPQNSFVEYIDTIPTKSNEFTIDGQTFVVEEPTSGIFGRVTETTLQTPTTSVKEKYQDRIVLPSRFNNVEEMYAYYNEVWVNQSAGRSALTVIEDVDLVEDELSIAASLAYLKEKGIDPLTLTDQFKLIQVTCLGSDYASGLEDGLAPLYDLFPETANRFMIKKSFIPLANEITAIIDVKQNGIIAVTYNIAYLTPEVAGLALQYDVSVYEGILVFLEMQNGVTIARPITMVRK